MELDSKRFADAVVLYPVGRIDHATAEGVAEATLTLEGLDVTTPCFIAPEGPALLGAVALENLFLGVDPVAKRLIPVEGMAG